MAQFEPSLVKPVEERVALKKEANRAPTYYQAYAGHFGYFR